MLVNYIRKPLYKGDIFEEATKLKTLQNKVEVADALYKGIVKVV